MRRINCPSRNFVPFTFLVLAFALALDTIPLRAASGAKHAIASDLFDSTNIVRINITIPESGMQLLRRTGWGHNGGGKRPETKATVSDGTTTFKDVAIRLKGAAGSFRPVDDRPALTLNFDKHIKDQRFHGIEKLSLNNSIQDPTYISEKLSRELYRKAGVPVPRADYALVTLNGRNLGLYVLVEGYNKQFLGQHFKRTGGNLYDGGFCQDITGDLTVNSGDKPNDQSDLQRLIKAVGDTRQSGKLSDLSTILDVDRFIDMCALDVLLCHWDGYALNRNNYRVYSDPESSKFVFMPHGLDQLFGQGRGLPDTSINPHMNGLVARAVMGTPEGRAKFTRRIGEIRTNFFQADALVARARDLEKRIHEVLPENRRRWHGASVDDLCRRIEMRDADLDRQFSAPPKELQFDAKGVATVEGWKPRNAVSSSQYHTVKAPNGKSYLQIIGDGASSSASWRTRVMLPAGRYRFEGMVRTKNAAELGNLVVLRVSGARQVSPIQADSKWEKCAFDFEIAEAIADVELVCEVRPAIGEVWFDPSSLRIVKISNN